MASKPRICATALCSMSHHHSVSWTELVDRFKVIPAQKQTRAATWQMCEVMQRPFCELALDRSRFSSL